MTTVTTTTKYASILSFPPELLEPIILLLKPSDLYSCILTNRDWYQTFNTYIWHFIKLEVPAFKHLPDISLNQFRVAVENGGLDNRGHLVETLHVGYYDALELLDTDAVAAAWQDGDEEEWEKWEEEEEEVVVVAALEHGANDNRNNETDTNNDKDNKKKDIDAKKLELKQWVLQQQSTKIYNPSCTYLQRLHVGSGPDPAFAPAAPASTSTSFHSPRPPIYTANGQPVPPTVNKLRSTTPFNFTPSVTTSIIHVPATAPQSTTTTTTNTLSFSPAPPHSTTTTTMNTFRFPPAIPHSKTSTNTTATVEMFAFGDPVVFGADPVVTPRDTVIPASGSNATPTSLVDTAPITATTATTTISPFCAFAAGTLAPSGGAPTPTPTTTTTTTTSLFGTAPTTLTTANPSLFGAAPAMTGSFFGTTPTATTTTSAFGAAPTMTGGLFGTIPTATTTASVFGTPLATTFTGGLSETTRIASAFGGSTPAFGTTPPTLGATPANVNTPSAAAVKLYGKSSGSSVKSRLGSGTRIGSGNNDNNNNNKNSSGSASTGLFGISSSSSVLPGFGRGASGFDSRSTRFNNTTIPGSTTTTATSTTYSAFGGSTGFGSGIGFGGGTGFGSGAGVGSGNGGTPSNLSGTAPSSFYSGVGDSSRVTRTTSAFGNITTTGNTPTSGSAFGLGTARSGSFGNPTSLFATSTSAGNNSPRFLPFGNANTAAEFDASLLATTTSAGNSSPSFLRFGNANTAALFDASHPLLGHPIHLSFLVSLLRQNNRLQMLSLEGRLLDPYGGVIGDLADVFAVLPASLQSLRLNGFRGYSLNPNAKLTAAQRRRYEQSFPHSGQQSLYRWSPPLPSPLPSPQTLPSLRTIRIVSCRFSDEYLSPLFKRCPNLQTLRIATTDYRGIPTSVAMALRESCPRLNELGLSGLLGFDEELSKMISASTAGWITLSIATRAPYVFENSPIADHNRRTNFFSRVSTAALLKHAPTLENLYLDEASGFDSWSIHQFLCSAPRLKRFALIAPGLGSTCDARLNVDDLDDPFSESNSRQWSCRSLEYFACQFRRLPRPDLERDAMVNPLLPGLESAKQASYVIHQEIYARLAQLTHLKVLILGKSDLYMSVESGLDLLANLKELEYVSCNQDTTKFWHNETQQWAKENWPKYGKGSDATEFWQRRGYLDDGTGITQDPFSDSFLFQAEASK
ncbi:MAG: hypothetical protein J3R72DRAFT_457581 [Linnemannia gamsii]|nr:MAG: hypothetical protein J3R72DRAFT_457581 [Linnemannia gamsii]